MNYSVPNTLDHYLHLPQLKAVDLSGFPLSGVQKMCGSYWKSKANDTPSPDNQAVVFYALNHMVSSIKTKFTQYEQLPAWADVIMKDYSLELINQSERLMYYLMMIITREARHNQRTEATYWTNKEAAYGAVASSFAHSLKGGSTATAQKFCEDLIDCTMGQYFRLIHNIFMTGSFGSQFGGKKWANVAKPLLDMIEGKISLEILVDTGYTLAHNNGPIFNKGMLYSKHTSNFLKILDVQRGGQMLEAIYSYEPGFVATTSIHSQVNTLKQEFPKSIGDSVDWEVVQKLGAIGKYVKTQKTPVAPQIQQIPKLGPGKKYVGSHAVLPGKIVIQYERVAG